MKAKKRYGQNFLIDRRIVEQIVQSFSASEKDLIIEIGPGRGALTKELLQTKAKILAYEIDMDMKEYLQFLDSKLLTIKYQDVLESNLKADISNISYQHLYLVGNLPYYITTPILEFLINQHIAFNSLTIMVQKEVAERFMAKPNTKSYGYFTLFLQYYYDIQKVCDVSRRSFFPSPNVDSMVIKLIPKTGIEDKSKEYFAFLKNVFSQKRKTLKNNIGNERFEKIKNTLIKYGFDEKVRAEQLSQDILMEVFSQL